VILLNIEILDKKENILLSRVKITAKISYDKTATPSKTDVIKSVSKALDIDSNLLALKKIDSIFGTTTAKVSAYQYFSKEDKEKLEKKTRKEKRAEKKSAEEPKTDEKKSK
jgi:ribosomal protein S24E